MIEYLDLEMINYYALNTPDYYKGENPQPISIDIMKILLFTSLMCSSDVVAAVSIVDYSK
jgi:hypothetical protein